MTREALELDRGCLDGLRTLEDGAVLEEIVSAFVAQGPERVSELNAAASRGDAATLRRLAHNLKGTAATLGLLSLARACRSLEGSAATAGGEALGAVERELRRAESALRGYARGIGRPLARFAGFGAGAEVAGPREGDE
jgi:HPt (histidine-containing phosphotransfer) domain-containing protein